MSLYENLKSKGYNFFVGVPCSRQKELVNAVIESSTQSYIPVAREDSAMAIAVGAYMAGKKPVVFLQNSGLGHLVNIISSLLIPYGIDIHLVVSIRTTPFQHKTMGSITKDLLELLNYKNVTFIEQ